MSATFASVLLALAAGQAGEPPTDAVGAAQVNTEPQGGRALGAGPQQLNPRAAIPDAPPQVAGDGRTVRAPAGSGSPILGRAVQVAPIGGQDRCDPARLKAASPAIRAACQETVERRAEEFAHPAPAPPSAEQQLLAGLGPAPAAPALPLVSGLPADPLAAASVAAGTQRSVAVSPSAAPAAGVQVIGPGAVAVVPR